MPTLRPLFRILLAALALSLAGVVPVQAREDGPAAAFEDAVLAEINAARTDPRALARRLRAERDAFDGRVLYLPEAPDGILTNEGVAAVDEAIAYLERQAPLPPLAAAPILAMAAGDHVADQGPRGGIGHVSSDGARPGDRVKRRGGDRYVGETISYGPRTGADVARQFVVDDGVPGRGHRVLLFSSSFRYAGIGCGPHRRHGTMCVVDFSATPAGGPVLPLPSRSVPAPAPRLR